MSKPPPSGQPPPAPQLPGPALPVDAALPALLDALSAAPNAVLEAPPGAGKTTRVPLALRGAPWARGRIVMLQPRRLAARAAAARLAALLGEEVGATVGLRIRGETRAGPRTRIEVVTEGVLTRMLQSDPALDGVSAVIFDEIHERALQAELGLALCLEAQAALRPELRLIAMSATLDAQALAALMGDAARLRAEGTLHPVETRWRDAPVAPGRLTDAVAETTQSALSETAGDALVFLPGAAEIARVAARLSALLPADAELHALHGDLPLARQQAALAPAAPGRRKVVLSSAIAETSLTVEGVRIVIDSGLARRSRFDPCSGMSRLITERASRAEADQRRGRAGRLGPGLCLRLWTKGAEGGMTAFAPPEILTADLAGLALDLALWGAPDGAGLAFLDPPPAPALAEARALLRDLGALDAAGALTATGRAMAAMPLHPRLAAMVAQAPQDERATACALAAILSERDPLRVPGQRAGVDLALRLEALADPRRFASLRGLAVDRAALARAAEALRRLRLATGARGPIRPERAGGLLALGWPDRIAQRRPGPAPRHLLSGGKGAALAAEDALAGAPLLVAADLDGDPREAAIRLAAVLSPDDLEAAAGARIGTRRVVEWSARTARVEAEERRVLGALTLRARPLRDAAPEEVAAALCAGVRALGLEALGWTDAAQALRARILWARAQGADLPDVSDAALRDGLEDWLAPWFGAARSAEDLAALDLLAPLRALLGRDGAALLDRAAPARFAAPSGSSHAVDYAQDPPTVALRAQELYGLDIHPMLGRAPLRLALLSPAGRPIALTLDLPGFWRGGWADARKEMRGRYPRHDWPERPWEASPPRARR
ncbi:ATP-dependent helicase HrpB [Rubrimonas sp.]|uniref:ATP-dependent helicase HrpB n=1 Tax=Rubrimonas sp. TaxID=2036015 RepID=UPI002FDE1B87